MNREDLTALSGTKNFKVSDEDPDVRGWHVMTPDGRALGVVRDLLIDPSRMKVEYLAVEDGTRGDLLVPIAAADLDRSGRRVLITSTDSVGFERATAYAGTDTAGRVDHGRPHRDDTSITRAEEELRIGKREVEAGEVVVAKHVEAERIREDVPVTRERVRVERRPVSEAYGSADIREDEIRVPLVEEELVVEKRAVVKEELVISKERITDTQPVDAEVRRERFDITGDTNLIDDDGDVSGRRK